MSESPALAATGAWAPLRHPVYRDLWFAQLVSNIGSWMQNVGAVWLMGTLGGSPALVALVQTATSLPVFVFGLPAGALADIIDRRRLLIVTQAWMLVAAAALGILTLFGMMSPGLLLLLTAALGIGNALNLPAWQAIQPDLVPRDEFHQAVALGGASNNLGRVIGPALGGLIVAVGGSQSVFLLNAVSFVGVVIVLLRWHKTEHLAELPAERLLAAIRTGLRYGRHSPTLQGVLARAFLAVVPSSALMALLPVVARSELGLDATGFGVLLAFFGAGALSGAVLLPRLRALLSVDALVAVSAVIVAGAMAVVAFVRFAPVLAVALFVGGSGWLVAFTTFNYSAQRALPAWVRARGMGLYLFVFQGGLAIGSAVFGILAERFDTRTSLATAALIMLAGILGVRRWRLARAELLELQPALHWPEPTVVLAPSPEQGPVLVTVDYRIDPSNAEAFADAMRRVERMRRRLGGYGWGLYRDPGDPSRFIETYLVESWNEHLRQHARVTETDRRIEEAAEAFLVEGARTTTSHFVSVYD